MSGDMTAEAHVRKKYRAVRMKIHHQMPQTRKVADALKETMLAAVADQSGSDTVDPRVCRMSKELFDKRNEAVRDLLAAKQAVVAHFHDPRYTLTLPDSQSMRLVCVERLREFADELDRRIAALREPAARFLQQLPALLQEQRERLGPLFAASDYVLPTDPERFYSVSVVYMDVEPPSYLREIDPELYRRQEAQLQTQLQLVVQQRERELLEGIFQVADRLLGRLRNDPDGPRTFQRSTVERLYELLQQADDDIRRLGLADREVGGVFRQLRSALAGHSPQELTESLRYDEAVQAAIADRLERIGDTILGASVMAPRRKFLFGLATAKPLKEKEDRCRD